MDLLEASRMRYTISSVITLCLFAGNIFAGDDVLDAPIDYFGDSQKKQEKADDILDTPIDYFGDFQKKKKSAVPAQKKPSKNQEAMQREIERNVLTSSPGRPKLYVFLKPGGRYSKPAVQDAIKFKKNHPEVDIQGVIISSPNLNEILRMKDVFSDVFSFRVDADLNLSKKFLVDKAPTFVICLGPDAYKIAGQPDLEKFYRKCLEKQR